MEDSEEWTSSWTQEVRVKVGSVLVDALINVAVVERSAINKLTGEKMCVPFTFPTIFSFFLNDDAVPRTEEQPAFSQTYEYIRGQKLGVIRVNQAVADRLARDPMEKALHPRHLPMLVPPKPWVDIDRGGYLYNNCA